MVTNLFIVYLRRKVEWTDYKCACLNCNWVEDYLQILISKVSLDEDNITK